MKRRKISKNAQCPCGTGKKYKLCCWGKKIEYLVDDEGNLYRSVPVTEEITQAIDEQRKAFAEKFGREPGPKDPIFFDLPPQEHLEAEMVKIMKQGGADPALVYAFEKTGLIVTQENLRLIPEADLAEWDAAVEEYRRKHR